MRNIYNIVLLYMFKIVIKISILSSVVYLCESAAPLLLLLTHLIFIKFILNYISSFFCSKFILLYFKIKFKKKYAFIIMYENIT